MERVHEEIEREREGGGEEERRAGEEEIVEWGFWKLLREIGREQVQDMQEHICVPKNQRALEKKRGEPKAAASDPCGIFY